jgi:hypothetical protein
MSADPNDELPTDGESLDALLREARWPSATQPAVARLTQHWEKVWVARRRREMLMRRAAGLALAAGLLGAVTIGLYRIRPQEKPVAQIKQPPGQSADRRASAGERGSVTKNPQPIEAAGHETRRPTSPDPTAVVDGTNKKAPSADLLADLASSRPPNELEQLMLDAAERTRKRTRAITKAAKQPENQRGIAHTIAKSSKDRRKASAASQTKRSEALMVATAVKRLVSDSSADIVKLAADVRAAGPRHEDILLETLERGGLPEQIAALRLLAEIGSPTAVGPALRAVAIPELHHVAVGTLVRLADSSVISEVALSEQNTELQRMLLASLFSHGEPVSLEQFLNFAADDKTADAALAAAQSVKNPPMDLLFSGLSDPLEARRIAAARVIGRIDGAATTRRLIAMVESGINRHEACIALLSSRGQEAVRYVDTAAEHDPSLAAIFSGARLFSVSDQPPRS